MGERQSAEIVMEGDHGWGGGGRVSEPHNELNEKVD